MTGMTVRLDDEIVAWARAQAKQYNMSLGRFMGKLVEEQLAYEEAKRARSSLWPRWPRNQPRR